MERVDQTNTNNHVRTVVCMDEATPTKRPNFRVLDDTILLQESLFKSPFEESQGGVMTVLLLQSFRYFQTFGVRTVTGENAQARFKST
ncbi:hypothetical protein PsorP6_001926 [Peronosclerospora sorghi]|uniref:Uncharacterized protein n=1 Tax=Peronosclerospora sorghi TaxID=230839 RepID=A0ACC0WT83_9STRA|nr:hypothetical protein PsorP6_001926 [Peronosclerospora sorghi]